MSPNEHYPNKSGLLGAPNKMSGEVRHTDVENILWQLRKEIGTKRNEVSPPASFSGSDQAVSADLATLRAEYDIYNTQFTSHRPLLGRFIILGKKIVREFLNPILVRQVAYNGANARVAAYLKGQVEALADRAHVFYEAHQQVQTLIERCSKLEQEGLRRFQDVQHEIETLKRQLEGIKQEQVQLKYEYQHFSGAALQDVHHEIETLERQLEGIKQEQVQLRYEYQHFSGAALATQSQTFQEMQQISQNLNNEQIQALENLKQRDMQVHESVRERLSRTERKLRRIIYALGGDHPDANQLNVSGKTVPLQMLEPEFDYFDFEETFRGSEEEIKARQEPYVQILGHHEPVLDVGSGRGEFLELLRSSGIIASGVDLDLDMVLHCRDKHLVVAHEDALDHLANRPDDSLGGVFSAQMVEHLEPPKLVRLLKLCHQKLKPDGILLLETLNPESLMVHYRWFCMDLTHKHLVHPHTLQFLLRSLGFRDIQRTPTTPPDTSALIPRLEFNGQLPMVLASVNQAIEHLNILLYSSADYAIVARK